MVINPEIRQCVSFIFKKRDDQRMQAIGTGFFVSKPSTNGKFQFIYLVTAKHVLLIDPKKDKTCMWDSVYVRINVKDYEPGQGKPGAKFIEIPSKDGAGNQLWHFHPDPSTDVAVLPWAPDQSLFQWKSIPINMFASKETLSSENVGEGDEIFFTGLLVQHVGEQRNYPVVRFGRVALLTEEKIATDLGYSDLHVTECQSFPGNSGSPVFLVLGPMRRPNVFTTTRILLFGIMHGYFPQPSEIIRVEQTATKLYSLDNVGIALVVPAEKLMETLENEPLASQRAVVKSQSQDSK